MKLCSSPAEISESFNSGRNRVGAAFNLLGIKFQEDFEKTMTGTVSYKMKNIKHQNRLLNMGKEIKKSRHTYFDDDGNALSNADESKEVRILVNNYSIYVLYYWNSFLLSLYNNDNEDGLCEQILILKFPYKKRI